jgi:hypothetical protein
MEEQHKAQKNLAPLQADCTLLSGRGEQMPGLSESL